MTEPGPRRELERIRDTSPHARAALAPGPMPTRLRSAILALADSRGRTSSTCPSDAARAVADEWRPLLPEARAQARDLAREGEVELTQRGETLDPDGQWRGPIRIRRA